MPSLIIVGYVWKILGRRSLFALPHLWAAPKTPILKKVKDLQALFSSEIHFWPNLSKKDPNSLQNDFLLDFLKDFVMGFSWK